MTENNITAIVTVLDRSGSMSSVRDDVIGGFNAFIEDQKKVPGIAFFTLAQFDDEYELIYNNVALSEVQELSPKTYVPRGSTALLDAIGRTIVATESKFLSMEEKDRPSKVIFFIITDGQENASQEHTHSKVKAMVEDKTNKAKWEFIFMGGAKNMDAVAQGNNIGISADNSYDFKNTKGGTAKLYKTLSDSLTMSRRYNLSFNMDKASLLDDDSDENTNK